jgi:hypothetical protein
MTHVGSAPVNEIDGNIIALNSLSGIPISAIQGFRAPYLNYTIDTMKHLKDAGFTYDSSTSSSSPANDSVTDAYWPYTLDNGFANDCLSVPGLCQGKVKLPGVSISITYLCTSPCLFTIIRISHLFHFHCLSTDVGDSHVWYL